MHWSSSSLAFASTLVLPVFSYAILDVHTCGIPYVIPKIFQRICDPADQVDIVLNTYVETDKKWRGLGPQVVTSNSIRSKPGTWNLEPYCLLSDTADACFCTYTSTTFANGRGLSIIAQPLQMDGVLQATAFNHKLEPYMNLGNDPRMEHVHVPGKGVGIVAKTAINMADRVLISTPVLAIQDRLMQQGTGQHIFPLLQFGVERLPKKTRDTYMALLGHWGGNPYHDRVHTNAFTMYVGKAKDSFWAMFPETSRFNHDCRPNTLYYIDPVNFIHSLRAGRQIQAGEEITLSYLSPHMTYQERATRIRDQWGFNCSCALCSAPEDVRKSSDNRVGLIEQLIGLLSDFDEPRNATTATGELLVSLYEKERLSGAVGDAHMYAAFEYAYVADRWNMMRHVELAIDQLMLWRGPQHPYYRIVKNMQRDPEGQRAWGLLLMNKAEKDKVLNGTYGMISPFEADGGWI